MSNVKALNFVGHFPHANHANLAYTSNMLKSIGEQMPRCLPKYDAIRNIKQLRINKRRIRLQKITKPEKRQVNFENLLIIPSSVDTPILNKSGLNFGSVNARSLRTSLLLILDLFLRENLDFLIITETWLGNHDDLWLNSQGLNALSIDYISIPHNHDRGGGILLEFRKGLTVSQVEFNQIHQCESGLWHITHNNTIHCLGIYHPPASSGDQLPNSIFVDMFLDDFSCLITKHSNLIITGDFNLHVNDLNDADATIFIDAMTALGFTQLVKSVTHVKGNTLDLVFTENNEKLKVIQCHPVDFVSDHRLVICQLANTAQVTPTKMVTIRPKAECDESTVITNALDGCNILNHETLEEMVAEYDLVLSNIFDTLHPPKRAKLTPRKQLPWYNEFIKSQRQVMRNREKIWLKYGEEHQWKAYKTERNRYRNLVHYHKCNMMSGMVLNCKRDTPMLYQTLNKLINCEKSNPLPTRQGDDDLANGFADFFLKICDTFQGLPTKCVEDKLIPKLIKFAPLKEPEVANLVNSMKAKSYELDPLPTHYIKTQIDKFIPFLTAIVNKSLNDAKFAESWKEAIVCPLLKKSNLELIYKNYRPVSNLQFISKLVERAALDQFLNHCANFNLLRDNQSAYCKGVSCETAVLKLVNDTLWSMENG